MDQERFVGLQWRLSVIYLGVGFLTGIAVVGGYALGILTDLSAYGSIVLGAGMGLVIALTGSAAGFLVARQMKLRLWDAGDFAVRIARGEFGARLEVASQDEIGWLEEQLNRMAAALETAVGDLRRLAEQNKKLAEEAGRGAALEERARLARDLHDTVNQQLFVLTMRAAAVRRQLERLGGEAAAFAPELSSLEEMARQAHSQTRDLIMQLRPTTLEQQGLGPALHEYVAATAQKEGWEAKLEIGPAIRLRGEKGEALFRIAQEALNNASKHARARTITVGLAHGKGQLRLVVRDDGEGFDPRAEIRPTAVGLAGMQERVRAVGGFLKIKSEPGQGTEVLITVPVTEEEAAGS
jgi:two-component system, NarL family, sensor histidine kinase LiaS